MDCKWRAPFFFRKKRRDKEATSFYIKNGSALLEGLIVAFGERYSIPIRNFTAKEIIKVTNNFAQCVCESNSFPLFKCVLEERQVLIKKYSWRSSHGFPYVVRDIVVSSQMSCHKNVLKLIGCCLQFEFPALVYENAGTRLLSSFLDNPDIEGLLPWNTRLKIASGIANAISYLHTAFDRPIIYNNWNLDNIIIDPNGVAKLVDFSVSVRLPPGKLQVEGQVIFAIVGFIPHESLRSSLVTQSNDVYGFGTLLLVLLTGMKPSERIFMEDYPMTIQTLVKDRAEKNQYMDIIDSKILVGCSIEAQRQMKAFLELALRCTQDRREDRPEMIEVAKELKQIESINQSKTSISIS